MPAARERSQVTPRTIWTIGLHVLLFLSVLTILRGAQEVIQWMLVALFLALALDPAVRVLAARRVPRVWAVISVTGIALGLIALAFGTLVPVLVDQGRSLVAAAPELLGRLRNTRFMAWADERFDVIARVQREFGEQAGAAAGPLFRIVGSVVHVIAGTITIAVLTIFMLLFGQDLFQSILEWVPPVHRDRVLKVVASMRRLVGGYVSGTLLIAGVGGVVTTVTLLLLGVPYFLPLGLVMILLGIVPFLGAALGGLLVVGATFLTAGTRPGLIALGVFLAYQQVENHLLQPLVQRRTIQMNPLAIALVLLVGTAFAGLLGALLALPIAAATHLLLEDLRVRRRQGGKAQQHIPPSTPPGAPPGSSQSPEP